MATTLIQVSATDNELIVLASTSAGSSELFHLKSGYYNPVAYQVIPQSILQNGPYDLTMVGISWGGPAAFTVTVTTDGVATPYTFSNPGAPVGVVWSQTVPITV